MTQSEYLKRVDDVRRHAYLYYVLDMPEISDAEYDLLFRGLTEYEEANPDYVSPITPTKSVAGGTRPKGVVYRHVRPMLSIENVFSYGELMEWVRSLEHTLKRPVAVVAEFKYDGMAVSIRYLDGVLQQVLIRGDGLEGEDVTVNALTIGTIRSRLPERFSGEIRGEVVIPIEAFEVMNDRLVAEGKKAYANPRNAAAGILRRDRPEGNTPLAFIPYDVIEHGAAMEINALSYTDRREWIRSVMLSVTDDADPTTVLTADRDARGLYIDYEDIAAWESIIQRFDVLRAEYPVATDGIVFKVQSAQDCQELGHGTRVVNYMRAYKFNALSRTTEVVGMLFQVGYTGAVTPVFCLHPVALAGVEVTRATVHNMTQLAKWRVRVGDYVEIERSGEVIPYVTGVIPTDGNINPVIEPIDHCPVCAEPLSTGRNSQTLYCVNTECAGRLVARLELTFSRDALNVKGVGTELLRELVDFYGYTLTPQFIFDMTKEDYQKSTSLGPKQIHNVMQALANARTQPLWRIIRAACIVGLGRSHSKILAKHAETKGDGTAAFIKGCLLVSSAFFDKGPLRNAVATMERDHEADSKLNAMLFLTPEAVVETVNQSTDPRLAGKRFCISGSIPPYNRDTLAAKLVLHGGEFTSSVSKKTDYLFYGLDAGSKLTKANELGVVTVNLCDPLVMEEWANVFVD